MGLSQTLSFMSMHTTFSQGTELKEAVVLQCLFGILLLLPKETKLQTIRIYHGRLAIGQRNVVLISAYKPPPIDNISFTSELITLLDNPFCITKNVIFIGNLNCDILNPLHNKEQGKCLLDICDVYDLASLITSPTQISKNTAPCLDVFLTNVPVFI